MQHEYTNIYIEGILVADAKMTTRRIKNDKELELVHVTVAVPTKEYVPETSMHKTNYYEITYGGHGYKFLGETLKKGDKISANGYFYYNTYEKNNQTRTAMRIEADRLNILARPAKQQPEKEEPFKDIE